METQTSFRVISYADQNFTPHSIERITADGKNEPVNDVLTIGDMVTNDLGMRGAITKFHLSNDLKTLSVFTTWSGVGYDIGQVEKVIMLPSRFQVKDQVFLILPQLDFQVYSKGAGEKIQNRIKANVFAVHFNKKKVKYDLEIKVAEKDYQSGMGGSEIEQLFVPTRIYNVDSYFVHDVRD